MALWFLLFIGFFLSILLFSFWFRDFHFVCIYWLLSFVLWCIACRVCHTVAFHTDLCFLSIVWDAGVWGCGRVFSLPAIVNALNLYCWVSGCNLRKERGVISRLWRETPLGPHKLLLGVWEKYLQSGSHGVRSVVSNPTKGLVMSSK